MSYPQELERPFFSDVESLFSEFVEYYGGKIVSKLEINKTDRQNADYLFEQPEIIAELKIFNKNVFSEAEDIPRLIDLFEKWKEKGYITANDLADYTFRGLPLPQKCMLDLIERATKTIERVIYKANKQIEETKKTLNKQNAYGIVILVNDGNYFFTNEGFLYVISSLIGRKFQKSSFDVIIYLTINQATYKEGSELDHSIWVPIYTKVDEQGETIASDELHSFVNTFGEKFLTEFMTLKTGHKPKDFKQIESMEESIAEFKKHKFIPKELIYKK
ncbi:hypothetical protein MD537_00775 [Flavihumibacter sediminis]|nr:hypothetical protein [Flavihumibacter sediminis]